jgi:nucleolar complex protein 3
MRPLTEAEKAAKVSKDVQKLRAFEESILSNYKSFLSSLVTIIKSARTNELLKQLSIVAVTCATSLLVAVPHFNYRTDLLKIIIAQLSRRTPDDAYIKCREALETLFKDDEEGRAALETVSMVSKMTKARNYKVHPSVQACMLQS